MSSISVFMSYAYGYREKDVLKFVNMLRGKGFEANMDKTYMDDTASTDIELMMHEQINSADKIIVILSEKYKDNAENELTSGVHKEYRLIRNILQGVNTNQVIFTTFEKFSKETYEKITPLWFKGFSILNLKESSKKKYNDLFAKLKSEKVIAIKKVSKKKPKIKKEKPKKFKP